MNLHPSLETDWLRAQPYLLWSAGNIHHLNENLLLHPTLCEHWRMRKIFPGSRLKSRLLTPIRADSALVSGNTSGSTCTSGSSFLFGAPSMSEFEYSCSSGSDISISLHRQPQRPPTPIPSMGKRHRRRKNSRLAGRHDKPRTQDARNYLCTFCCDSFRVKSSGPDMKSHFVSQSTGGVVRQKVVSSK